MDSATSPQVVTDCTVTIDSINTDSVNTDSMQNPTDKPSRLADIPPEDLNTPVDGDNIADDLTSDLALAEFIQDIENSTVSTANTLPKKMPSVADLYMMHVGAQNSSQIKYYDEIDEYNDLCDDPSDGQYTFTQSGPMGKSGSNFSSFHPRTSGYSDYVDNTYAQWQKKSSNKPKISRKVASYLDEPTLNTDVGEILEDAIDAVGDRVDAIYDCVKGVDQQVNDLYEKSLGVGDTIEDLQEASRSQTLRGVEIEKRLQSLEIAQSKHENALADITKMLTDITKTVNDLTRTVTDLAKTIYAIKTDTGAIRLRV